MQQALDQTNPPISQDWRRFLPAITAALLGIILTGGMFLAAREYDERRLQLEFNGQGDEIESILQSRVAGNIELLQSIANFHAASVEVSPDEFRRFTQTALNRPSVRALGWASSEPDGFIVRFIE